MENLKQDIEKILFSHEKIVNASKRIAKQIEEDYKDKEPVLLCTLKGALPFMAEVMKHIDIHVVTDFIDVSSYHGGTCSSGSIKINKDVAMDVKDKDVIIIEDIVDTGRTLKCLIEYLKELGVNSVTCASLVDKPEARIVEVQADYIGIESPNAFLVGFGLDYEEKYRNLPYIGVLKKEIYTK
ncbi:MULTISPECIES: hypoxanthine phosphoribosyltransferase [Gemella]|uniref:hypoxanthine phosphoribosyltransferase n=1 Tax=Gemella TaxID=1378 RepID=UPI0007683A47|nr:MULTISPECIES: hypoxanthine phosphoribosyltransferase [Gemella]AME08810.1 hypoxanthine phosphoribosyltransferase [Gemella sp. oral taxon 928]AXI26380.1 hypoxanthine phosphoribosyltransferase [Gemella sp. ND 6198]